MKKIIWCTAEGMSSSELQSIGEQLKDIEDKSGGEYHFILTNKQIAVMSQEEARRLLELVLNLGARKDKISCNSLGRNTIITTTIDEW